MHPIVPFLWFNDNGEEAVNFYTSLFQHSKVNNVNRYIEGSPGPVGKVMTVDFTLCGKNFAALNGGPVFSFTPAVSFFVSCETLDQLNTLWEKLVVGGSVLMEKQKYPFSEQYGWLNDKYGVSWQLNLTKTEQKIAPAFLFVGKNYGKAEEAINFYLSLFEQSTLKMISKNGKENPNEKEGTVQYANFTLNGQDFNAMEGNAGHQFTFTPAISFVVTCDTQQEIDMFWEKLSADPASEQCGWLKDKYGISWQIVPSGLGKWIGTKEGMQAMLQMKKLDIAALKKASGDHNA